MQLTEKTVNILVIAVLALTIYFGLKSFNLTKYQTFFANLRQLSTQITPSPQPSPSPKPTPYTYHMRSPAQKKYLLALGAILSEQNNENFTVLRSNLTPASLRPLLVEWWNISDRNSAIEVLEWLRDEGHRSEYDNLYAYLVKPNITTCKELNDPNLTSCSDKEIKMLHDLAQTLKPKLAGKTIAAWDYGRLVNVARWCYTLGYINEQEAWTYIVPAASKLQEEYDTWQDYGDHYILGRGYWLRDLNSTKQQEAILKYLLNPLTKTPWTTLGWRTNLN